MAVARLQLPANKPGIGPAPTKNEWHIAVVGYPLWLWADGATQVGFGAVERHGGGRRRRVGDRSAGGSGTVFQGRSDPRNSGGGRVSSSSSVDVAMSRPPPSPRRTRRRIRPRGRRSSCVGVCGASSGPATDANERVGERVDDPVVGRHVVGSVGEQLGDGALGHVGQTAPSAIDDSARNRTKPDSPVVRSAEYVGPQRPGDGERPVGSRRLPVDVGVVGDDLFRGGQVQVVPEGEVLPRGPSPTAPLSSRYAASESSGRSSERADDRVVQERRNGHARPACTGSAALLARPGRAGRAGRQ